MDCNVSMIDMEPRHSEGPLPTCMALRMFPTIPDASLLSNSGGVQPVERTTENQNWLPPARCMVAERQPQPTPPKPEFSPVSTKTEQSPDFLELLQAQNKQLQMLQNQVEKILSYQEQLQVGSSPQAYSSPKSDNCTQTSIIESPSSNFIPRTMPKNSVGVMTSAASPKLTPQTRLPTTPTYKPQNSYPSPKSLPDPEVTCPNTELSLNFRDLHLETIHEQPNTPQESFLHINMQDYPESPSQSINRVSLQSQDAEHIYGNLLGQVRKLLAQGQSCDPPAQDFTPQMGQRPRATDKNSVRTATLRRIQDLGISFIVPSSVPTKPEIDSIYIPQARAPIFYAEDSYVDNDSPNVDQLVHKYLHKSQSAPEGLDGFKRLNKPEGNFGPKDVDFSMATVQYMQRYGLTGAEMDHEPPRRSQGDGGVQHSFATRQFLARYQLLEETIYDKAPAAALGNPNNVVRTRFSAQETLEMQRNWPPTPDRANFAPSYQPDRVLDMTMLKQQPKLL